MDGIPAIPDSEETSMKTRLFLKVMALPLALHVTRGMAQGSSGRPIRVVVPLPAGTALDVTARLVLNGVSKVLNQNIIVDNKPGANGVLGTMEVVRAAPDGATLLCATNSHMATNLAFVKGLPYDPRRDLTPIAGMITGTQALVVAATSPIRSLADFIAHAKANPGKLSVGYSTSIVQLEFATLAKMAGVQLLPIPYKGAPQAANDMIGGVLDATMETVDRARSQVKAGQMRALAVTSKRSPLFPDLPAISELLPGFDFPTWNAFFGPAGMPRELVNRLSTVIAQVQRQPDVSQQLNDAGSPPFVIEPDDLKAFISTEIGKYARLAKEAGMEAQ
jgi:tripartite-type tricarboxylate transporter receptor subunit TctC